MPKDYMLPVGYSGSRSDPRVARFRERKDPFLGLGLEAAPYEDILNANRWIVGSPDTVVRKLRDMLANPRPCPGLETSSAPRNSGVVRGSTSATAG